MKKEEKKSVENCCETESCCTEKNHCKCGCHKGGNSCAIYGLGVVGSLFYFLSGVSGFSPILLAIGKSFFWPAVLIFRIFTDLKL